MKNIVIFLFSLLSSSVLWSQSIVGPWYGIIDLQEAQLKVAIEVADTMGYLQTSFTSPTQGAYAMKADTTYLKGDSLHFEVSTLEASFTAKYAPSPEKLTGNLTQFGNVFSIKMTRDSFPNEANLRPQDPRKVDYFQENVLFANYTDSVILAGTLTMPYEPGIKKAVVLITGSGPQNRNNELVAYNHRPYLVLSDYLTRQGMAVLRYDDRGVGLSSGHFPTATTEEFTRDALSAVQYLRSRIDLEGAEVGVIGHGEGGLIASMLGDTIDFRVLLATPGNNTPEFLLAQNYLLNKMEGVPDSILSLNYRLYAQVYNYIKQTSSLAPDSLQKNIVKILTRGYSKFPSEMTADNPSVEKFIQQQAMILSSPWYRYFLSIEPYYYLSQINTPVLAMTGTMDFQVPYQSNLTAIEAALKKAGNEQYQLFGFEGVNHYFQTALSGSLQEYGLLTETMNTEVMKSIADWITSL